MTNMLTVLQTLSSKIPLGYNTYPSNEYNLCPTSCLLDIGSGFGKPVFHAALQTGCYAEGIEIVPARVEFSLGFLYDYKEQRESILSNSKMVIQSPQHEEKMMDDEVAFNIAQYIDKKESILENLSNIMCDNSLNIQDFNAIPHKSSHLLISAENKHKEHKLMKFGKAVNKMHGKYDYNWVEKVKFSVCDAEKISAYDSSFGMPFSHIYSYNKIMGMETLTGICKALNMTDYRVLAWYFDEKETEKFGLQNFKLVHKMPMPSTGKECFTCYIYIKMKPIESYAANTH